MNVTAQPRKRIKLTIKGVYPDNPELSFGKIKDEKDALKGWLTSPKISANSKISANKKLHFKENSKTGK